LLDGGVKLSTFTDQAVARAAAQDLLRRVSVEEMRLAIWRPSFEHAYATVEVDLSDGSTVRERCDVPRSDGRARSVRTSAKFRDCLDFAHTDWDADVAETLDEPASGQMRIEMVGTRYEVGDIVWPGATAS
jgi:hypothetical protein